VKVRWSAKRRAVEPYNANTAPAEEWSKEAGAAEAGIAGTGATPLSGAELSPDQAARLQAALGALGLGGTSSVRVARVQDADGGARPDPIEQLEKLAELRSSGALTDAEFEQEKHRVLNEH
jgi:hypothetical protein